MLNCFLVFIVSCLLLGLCCLFFQLLVVWHWHLLLRHPLTGKEYSCLLWNTSRCLYDSCATYKYIVCLFNLSFNANCLSFLHSFNHLIHFKFKLNQCSSAIVSTIVVSFSLLYIFSMMCAHAFYTQSES
jgi:hypothetical protein